MGVRPRINIENHGRAIDRLNRQLARAYLIWLVGIFVGAIELKPQKFELGGIAYIIENPDVLQGIIFVACLVYYIAIIANVIMFGIENTIADHGIKRRMLYSALGTKRTLIGRDKFGVLSVKLSARVLLGLANLFFAIYLFLPLLHILIFNQVAFLKGIDAIFHTESVQNDKVVLASVPVAIGTLCALVIWTSFLSRKTKSIRGQGFDDVIFINVLAGGTFALADYLFRGQEELQVALMRIGALQFTIFAVWALARMCLGLMSFWFRVRLSLAQWRLRRLKSKVRGT